MKQKELKENNISFNQFKKIVLDDFKIACQSRDASLLGRREVLTGKAKFGIFGDGKELAQIAMAKAFKNGDFRSGYYRDQTFMFAIKQLKIEQFFSQLYAHPDLTAEPSSAGRQMTSHFATRSLDENGEWKNLMEMKNSAADVSCTAAQMPRLVGLAQASKIYRNNSLLKKGFEKFSLDGNEVAFGTIGNASTSEGLFFESINAAGVLQIPMVISIWDDEYGISVESKYQTTKQDISEILKGFQRDEKGDGFEMFVVKGWDYVALCEVYQKASDIARKKHIPVFIHVKEMTQPQGHSTSGSHERYKSKERLQWEQNFDCIKKMEDWMLENNITNAEIIQKIKDNSKKTILEAKSNAWRNFQNSKKDEVQQLISLLISLAKESEHSSFIQSQISKLEKNLEPFRKDIFTITKKIIREVRNEKSNSKHALINWLNNQKNTNKNRYNTHLYSQSSNSPINISEVLPIYNGTQEVDARIIIRDNFDLILKNYSEVLIFGEDTGKIGDVNQGLEGLQKKYGELRVSDTGIREATILGQAIGMAMRGLRPIAEIQYLDYLLYAIQTMSDDLASLHYRTKGGQKAPVIVRTRGHRLEGIWHSGSPMGMIINALRGMHVLVPRNMTKAAGFYNSLLASDDPALVIECLNGYRLKEKLPANLSKIRTPIGISEITKEGKDITLVTYGSTWRIVMEAAKQLADIGINAEVIDVQSLLPFDLNNTISNSIKKTNKVAFIDEDLPGGTTAYMMQQVLEKQNAYNFLDSKPISISSKAHRPAYGDDGDYFSKPNVENIFDTIYTLIHEYNPKKFSNLY